MTPFMSAVSGRAYPAAITILETAQKIAKGTPVSVIISMWFPSKVMADSLLTVLFLYAKLHVLEQLVMVVNTSFQNTILLHVLEILLLWSIFLFCSVYIMIDFYEYYCFCVLYSLFSTSLLYKHQWIKVLFSVAQRNFFL